MVKNQSFSFILKRLWRHISLVRRRQFAIVFVLTILSSFAEIVSLGAVIPFIGIITQPDLVFDYPFLASFIESFGIEKSKDLVLPLTLGFLVLSIFAGGLRMLLVWFSIYTSNSTGADLGVEIYRRTLYQPYSVHISRSSSEVLSGMTIKINAATGAVAIILNILTSGMLFTAIISTLFVINPEAATVAVAIFGLAYILIAVMSRYRVSRNGERIAKKEILIIKMIQEGLGGIRDIILDGTQSVYYGEYRQAVNSLVKAHTENKFVNQAPRYFMEILGIVLISILVIVMHYKSNNAILALPILGALALGAQRSLPLMQQFYAGWTSLLGNKASLIDVLDLLDQPLPKYINLPEIEPLNLNHSLSFDNVTFRYSMETPLILNGISFKISKGARVGIIGTTGSGKSTALDLLMGMLDPTEGQILVDDQPINIDNQRAWQRAVAHVPQAIFLADKTIAENIALGTSIDKIDFKKVKKSAQQARLDDYISSTMDGYSTLVGERGVRLSGGQRQRIGIARALYKNASVLIFDEATSSLDNETEQEVMLAIEELNKDLTLFIIAHRLSTLKNCSHIIEISKGKIINIGTYDDIINKENS